MTVIPNSTSFIQILKLTIFLMIQKNEGVLFAKKLHAG